MLEPLFMVPAGLIIAAVIAYVAHKNKWKIAEFF